jgi:serine/threonine-protein kinase
MGFRPRRGGSVDPGTPLGSAYVLHQAIGRGGMGQVWLGSVRAGGQAVAVKVLNSEFGSDPEVVSRFLQERAILLGLHHPHLVAVRDLVAEGETLAIVMELVQGSDLRRHLADHGPLAPAFVAGLMAQVLTGLATVHGAGIIHRDLKPENVLLDTSSGELPVAKLSDFGIARLTTGPALTRMTGLIGTPDYMAPEVANQQEPTSAVDVYAAGVMLYELLAGRTPFAGGPAVAVLRRHLDEAPARPEGMTDQLWDLVAAMLAKDPALRPTAAAAAERLVAMVPALLSLSPQGVAGPDGEGAAEPDPNVTRLPGYQPVRPGAEAVRTGQMPVPLPLAATGAQRATAAGGDQQLTMLPGRARVLTPLATPAAARGTDRRTLIIAGALVGALLVVILGVGLLARSGSSHPTAATGASQSSGGATAGGAVVAPRSGLPASGKLNDGEFDTSFDHDTAGFKGRDGMMDVRWIPAGADGSAYVEFTCQRVRCVAQRSGSGQVTWIQGTKYLITALIRSHSGATITGTIQLSSVVNGVPKLAPLKFSASKDWTTLTTANGPLWQNVSGTGLIATNLELDAAGAALDMRMIAYTYSS